MNINKNNILILTPFFSPNIGGVEAHLDSLCEYLSKNNKNVYVVTYKPITINKPALTFEQRGNIEIHRYPWFGRNLFHRLEKHFFLNFLYISSGLFLYSLYFLIMRGKKVNVIHAQGLNASAVSLVLGKIFHKKVVVSLHTIYRLEHNKRLSPFVKFILNRLDKIFVLGKQGKVDLEAAGINPEKIEVYNYWVDKEKFTIKDTLEARRALNLPLDKFIALFVGRFVKQKGLQIVTRALKALNQKEFLFLFIGHGPEKVYLDELMKVNNNVLYLGPKSNEVLIDYYNASNVLLWGSIDNSYLGRVCIEALYCGLPIIAPNRCRILEVDYEITDETLPKAAGFLINHEPVELTNTLKEIFVRQEELKGMRSACREFALEHYGLNNADKILNSY